MKKLFLLFFLIQKIGCCSITEPLSIDVGAGCKVGNFNYTFLTDDNNEDILFQEKYKNFKYIQTKVSIKTINRGPYLFAFFAYSHLLNDNISIGDTSIQNIYNLIYNFDYQTKGYDLESLIEIGYASDLTPGRMNKFIVIPLVGYGGFWKSIKRKDVSPNPYTYPEDMKIITVNSYLPKRLKQLWYGPYIGGKLTIIPNDRVIFDLGYRFNWLKLKYDFSSLLVIQEYDQSLVLQKKLNVFKNVNEKVDDCYSHNALAKVTFVIMNNFKMAIMCKYDYLLSNKEKVKMKEKEELLVPAHSVINNEVSTRLLARLWDVRGIFELIYQF